jgi:uncharacterized protein YfaS (alpha-2-macroglobulin family)
VGAVPVGIKVQSGKYTSTRRVEVSLRPAIAWRQQVRAGRAAPNAQIDELRRMYAAHSTRRLSASPTPLVALDGLSAYLGDYPHQCTEQLLSQAFPALVYAQHPELGKLDGAKDPAALMAELAARQNSEGGLGLWKATPDAEPFVSAYAGLYLVEARERGVPVPKDLMEPLNRYLTELAGDASDHDLASLRTRALAVYVLVRQGRTESNRLGALQEQLKRDQPDAWMDDVTGLLVAASYQRLQQDKAARPLATRALAKVNAVKPAGPDDPFLYYYDAGIEHAWRMYLLQRHFAPLAARISPAATDALIAPLREDRYNTLSAALTVLALEAHAPADPGKVAKALPTLLAAGADGKPRVIGKAQGLVVQGDAAPADTRLSVRAAPGAPAWWVLNESGFDRAPPKAQQSQGLEVVRDYIDAKGNPQTSIEQGAEVIVRLRVRALGNRAYGPVAIVDLLPGGFEAVMQLPAPTADAASDEEEGYDEECSEYDECEGGDSSPAPPVPVLALPESTLMTEHVEVREDRIVLYAYATGDVQEFRYRVRANNVGRFVVAPIYGEAMYRPSVYAQGGPAGTIVVTTPKP